MCEIWPNPCQHLHLFGRKGQMSHLPQGGVARGLSTGARETLLADRQVVSAVQHGVLGWFGILTKFFQDSS